MLKAAFYPRTSYRPSRYGDMVQAKSKSALKVGDSVSITGEVTIVHDNGTVTVRVLGLDYPVTIGTEHLSLIASRLK